MGYMGSYYKIPKAIFLLLVSMLLATSTHGQDRVRGSGLKVHLK